MAFRETKLRETEGNITHLKYSKYSMLSLASLLVPLSTSTIVDMLTLAEQSHIEHNKFYSDFEHFMSTFLILKKQQKLIETVHETSIYNTGMSHMKPSVPV